MYRTYELAGPFSNDDINWINNSKLSYTIERPHTKRFDTGWGDGRYPFVELITRYHSIKITVTTPEQETWLTLYWDKRAICIYQDHFI